MQTLAHGGHFIESPVIGPGDYSSIEHDPHFGEGLFIRVLSLILVGIYKNISLNLCSSSKEVRKIFDRPKSGWPSPTQTFSNVQHNLVILSPFDLGKGVLELGIPVAERKSEIERNKMILGTYLSPDSSFF